MTKLTSILFGALVVTSLSAAPASSMSPQDPSAAPSEAEVRAEDAPAASPLVEVRDLSPQQAQAALDQTLGFLLAKQKTDGSWGSGLPEDLQDLGYALDSYYAWNQAANALVLMTLMDAPASVERERALRAGLAWLCNSRMAYRGSDWDVDSTWASLYGFTCLVQAAQDARLQDADTLANIERRGMEFYADLVLRQTLEGGWAYYDDPPFSHKPTWATSFCTALVLPALIEAEALGWKVDARVAERATKAIQRAALPNGAYTYDVTLHLRSYGGESINQVQGSLGRIQVCNWALARAGVKRITPDVLREGLESFFSQHAYLDMARRLPIPHEGHFANAGYFYFFAHLYAAKVIDLLPEAERELWHRRLRFHITKTLREDGSSSDFLNSRTQVIAGTSFASLVLAAGLSSEMKAQTAPAGEVETKR